MRRVLPFSLLAVLAVGCGGAPDSEPAASTGAVPAADTVTDNPIPAEWIQVAEIGGEVAGAVSGVGGAAAFASAVLSKLGFLGSTADPTQQKLDIVLTKIDKAIAASLDSAFILEWQNNKGAARNASGDRQTAYQWVTANPNTPLPLLSMASNDSANSIQRLSDDVFWIRAYDDRIYSNTLFQKAVPDRAQGNIVWDWRLALPALVGAISDRLFIASAVQPGFNNSDNTYTDEFYGLAGLLQRTTKRMRDDVRCGKSYAMTSSSGATDQWIYVAGCGDIDSGASAYTTNWWWDHYQPSQAWVDQQAATDIAAARQNVLHQLGVDEVDKLAYKLYSFGRFAITGVNDRDSVGALHYVELYGEFPVDWNVHVNATCNGAAVPSVAVTYHSRTQINVSFPEQPAGTSCVFTPVRQDNLLPTRTGTSSAPVTLHPPVMQIKALDLGGVANGRNYYELWGSFADPRVDTLISIVNCDGGWWSSKVEYQSTGQVNVSIPIVPRPIQCSFALARSSDGRQTPVWGPVWVTKFF